MSLAAPLALMLTAAALANGQGWDNRRPPVKPLNPEQLRDAAKAATDHFAALAERGRFYRREDVDGISAYQVRQLQSGEARVDVEYKSGARTLQAQLFCHNEAEGAGPATLHCHDMKELGR